MRTKDYVVLQRAVEEGVTLGYRRAHKHVEHPEQGALCDSIVHEVLNAVCDVFVFEPLPEEDM